MLKNPAVQLQPLALAAGKTRINRGFIVKNGTLILGFNVGYNKIKYILKVYILKVNKQTNKQWSRQKQRKLTCHQ